MALLLKKKWMSKHKNKLNDVNSLFDCHGINSSLYKKTSMKENQSNSRRKFLQQFSLSAAALAAGTPLLAAENQRACFFHFKKKWRF